MTPQEIIDNNILLAEFLGWKTDIKGRYIATFGEMDESGYMRYDYEKRNLQFDCDWNWLMEVVDKIESLEGCEVILSKYLIEIYKGNLRKSFSKITTFKIEATYNACVEFVKWSGQNK